MRIVDSRRLTGRNLHADEPGAIAWVRLADGESPEDAIARWRAALENGLSRLGWRAHVHARIWKDADGAPALTLMFTAPVDRLYAATELDEWAIACANGEDPPLEPVIESAAVEQAERAAAMRLVEASRARGLPALIDDERVSVGEGKRSRTWSLAEVPAPDAVDWEALGRIPVALVTGTNGKTTTARMLARVARESGLRAGNSSTDGIYVDGALVESGDWTGPGAAREILRRPELELAVLEVARGGLLRRGLEIEGCEAAIVTNVDADHLGEEGIHDLAGLAAIKGLVAQAVAPTGTVVLGADSPALVEWARTADIAARVEWFSLDPRNPVLREHVGAGHTAWTVVDDAFVRRTSAGDERILGVDEVPLTFGGRARHNVANTLGVLALAHALKLDPDAITAALRAFGREPGDNPGRANLWELPGGVSLLTDFAHNLAGIEAITELVGELGRRVIVSFGMAGDRSDAQLRELGGSLMAMHPEHVVVREQDIYLRGRPRGVIPQLLAQGLRAAGLGESAISFATDEVDSLERARALATDGDVIVLLVHAEREAVEAWTRRVGARPGLHLAPPHVSSGPA